MGITIIWDITKKCNLKCIHCFNADRYTSPFYNTGRELSTQQAKLAIDKFKNGGVRHLHLLGGEPLLREDIVEIIKYAKENNFIISINTNGILLNEHLSKELLKLKVEQIVVSIDGATQPVNDGIRGRGTYHKIIKNIKNLQKLNKESGKIMNVGLAFTLLKQNLHEVPLILDLAAFLEVDVIDIMELYVSGRAFERQNEFRYTQKERIEVLEKVAEKIRKNNYNFLIQMDMPLSLVKYLNWRYSINIFFIREIWGVKLVKRCGICRQMDEYYLAGW
ncbi:MAG: radical SAM protein [Candidatus Omnitrophica bacterium]|nr:radical SAM protein [Candidatus Omnitrophota bacterium]